MLFSNYGNKPILGLRVIHKLREDQSRDLPIGWHQN